MNAPAETYFTLPGDFAQALGQTIASFGWLEEIIKRTIYALDRARLADDLTHDELQTSLTHMGNIADDSMGTLIEQLDAAMRRHPGLHERTPITDRLAEIKQQRNLLCHASWRPTAEKGRWHPAFVNTGGKVFDRSFTAEELESIRQATVDIGTRVLRVMRATGTHGKWVGDDA